HSAPRKKRTIEMKNIQSLPIKERLALAQDEDTSEEVLAILAQDEDEDVLLAVWNNPSTDVDVREELLYHPSDWLRQTIAEDPHLYGSACVILAQDDNAGVRERIAENPNTPTEVRAMLAQDEDVLFAHEGVEYTRADLHGADLA